MKKKNLKIVFQISFSLISVLVTKGQCLNALDKKLELQFSLYFQSVVISLENEVTFNTIIIAVSSEKNKYYVEKFVKMMSLPLRFQ